MPNVQLTGAARLYRAASSDRARLSAMLGLGFELGRAMTEVLRQGLFIAMNDFSCCWVFDDFPIQILVFIDNSLLRHPFVIGFP